MMKIEFQTDNDAFVEGYASEIELILDKIKQLVNDGEDYGKIFDSNGNKIGTWALDVPEEAVK